MASFREFSSCPEDFRVVLLDHFLTLFLCSFWYKSTGIKKKWSQFRITHFLKRLFRAIWLFETRFRAWNNFYMDHSTDTPTHPSTQYRNALGIRSRTTSRITRTTSSMHLESVSSSSGNANLWFIHFNVIFYHIIMCWPEIFLKHMYISRHYANAYRTLKIQILGHSFIHKYLDYTSFYP